MTRSIAAMASCFGLLIMAGSALAQPDAAPRPGPTMAGPADDADLPPPLPDVTGDSGYAYGGVAVLSTAAPWQAQIYSTSPLSAYTAAERRGRSDWEMPHRCGGTVIARNWILTAAHCVKPASMAAGRRVRLGALNIERDKGVTFRIDDVVTHPDYRNSFRRNDIALIRFSADRLSGPRAAAAIAPLGALDRGTAFRAEDKVTALGWGKYRNVGAFQTSAALLSVTLAVVPQPDCRRLWVDQEVPDDIVLCAAGDAVATCAGDSGGPVVVGWAKPMLVGVVAGGNKYCTGNSAVPGIYTRVAAFRVWIDCVIKHGKARCERQARQRR